MNNYWTKELPTEAGWYWVKEQSDIPATPYFIYRSSGRGEMEIEDPYDRNDTRMTLIDWNQNRQVEFNGPFREPEPNWKLTQKAIKEVIDSYVKAGFYLPLPLPEATGADLSPQEAETDTSPSLSNLRPSEANVGLRKGIVGAGSEAIPPDSAWQPKWANDGTGKYAIFECQHEPLNSPQLRYGTGGDYCGRCEV